MSAQHLEGCLAVQPSSQGGVLGHKDHICEDGVALSHFFQWGFISSHLVVSSFQSITLSF